MSRERLDMAKVVQGECRRAVPNVLDGAGTIRDQLPTPKTSLWRVWKTLCKVSAELVTQRKKRNQHMFVA